MQLLLEEGTSDSFILDLIVSYLKLQQRGKVKLIYLSQGAIKAQKLGKLTIRIPTLITKEGQLLSQLYQISTQLINVLPQWKQFFFGTNEQQVNQISNIKTQIKQPKQFKKYLNKYLQGKTFFVSNHLTFADLFMFVHTYDTMIQLTDQHKHQFCNLFRWYKHIQNLPQIKEFLIRTQRFIISDPQVKVSFIAEKKKKKQKTQKIQKKQKIQKTEQTEKNEKNEKNEQTQKLETKPQSLVQESK